jgi:hypothetical protein
MRGKGTGLRTTRNLAYRAFGVGRRSKQSHRRVLSPARASESGTVVDICLSFAPLGARGLFLFLEIRPQGAPFGLLAIRPLGRALLLGRFAHFAQG